MRKILICFCLLMLTAAFAVAQNKMVTGKVTNEQGNPIPFATIMIKGTRTAVAADANGKFQINIGKGSILIISSQNMEPLEINTNGRTEVDVTLKSLGQLAEVVVTGVGVATTKK
jgi:TRAP-type C4-dicarboxylate transport system substrate-binding protein